MSEYSLDGLVNQFAVVLNAMTESESLLRDQVRRVRLRAQGQQVDPGVASFSPAPHPAGSVRPEPVSASDGTALTAQGGEPQPPWKSAPAPAPANRRQFSEAEPASPVTGQRNYDYFSELDEKLTGLRQHYLE
jgi:hypothetical protein